MLFRERGAVYFEIHTKHTNALCGHNAGRTYNNHWALMG
jgi:hypothetical protein